MAIKDTRVLTCKASELTVAVLQEFIQPLDGDAVVKVLPFAGTRTGDAPTITLEAEIDISKGRIW